MLKAPARALPVTGSLVRGSTKVLFSSSRGALPVPPFHLAVFALSLSLSSLSGPEATLAQLFVLVLDLCH